MDKYEAGFVELQRIKSGGSVCVCVPRFKIHKANHRMSSTRVMSISKARHSAGLRYIFAYKGVIVDN